MKKYTNSHPGIMEMAEKIMRFNIKDCTGVFYIKRPNTSEFYLMLEEKEGDVCAGVITTPRHNEFCITSRRNGIPFEKRVKYSHLKYA